ncbi:MAG TPA: hypothetical protein PKW82_05290 [Spirochaetales bacterium]|nr:hypothetical protein [Spirochaetales bacterium]
MAGKNAGFDDAADFVDGADFAELDALAKRIEERRLALRKEGAKGLMKKLHVGAFVRFDTSKGQEWGVVAGVTEEYVSVRGRDQTRGRQKRLEFHEVLELTDDEPPAVERMPEPAAGSGPKKRGRKPKAS